MTAAGHGEPVIVASGVTKRYSAGSVAVTALAGVDLEIERGRFVAVMGPSGSGKSTLLHCLAGLDTIDSGTVDLAGTRLTGLSDKRLSRLRRDRMGFVFQAFNLLPTLTARQNIELPLRLARRTGAPAWFDEVVTTLGIADRLGHRPGELSGGQQSRVAIGRALVNEPDVVFADEPTGSLDTRMSAEVLALLRTSVRDLGRTVVMVTHDATAAAAADRVVFLVDGVVAADLTEPGAEVLLRTMQKLETA